MEKILFENQYFASKQLLQIYTKEILAKRFQKQFWILVTIFAVLLIISLITQDAIASVLTGGCFLISLLITIFAPRFMFQRLKNIQQRLHNGKNPKTLVQLGEKIRLKEGKCDITMDYAQITEIYFLPQIYVLMFAKSNGVLLKSDGFITGTSEAFRGYITERCPTARIYQWDS